jgi:hypothetical protein
MFHPLKALPLALAVAALSLFTSCGSNNAQIRVVHAIADATALDVDINGTKQITDISFDTVQPSSNPATYVSVPSGNDTIEAFVSGSTTNTVLASTNISLSSSTQYTVVLGGSAASAIAFNLTDNNTVPVSGDVEFRIINASPSGPGGSGAAVDVYIVPPGTGLGGLQPQISGLSYTQASPYQPLNFAATGYEVIVTPTGNQTPYIQQNYVTQTGSITTLVLLDNLQGGSLSDIPLELFDLQ